MIGSQKCGLNNLMTDISDFPEFQKIEQIIQSVVLQEIEILTDVLEEQLNNSPDGTFNKDNINPDYLARKTISYILFKICHQITKNNSQNTTFP